MSNKLSLLVNFVGVDKMSGALRNIIGLGRKGSRSLNELRGSGQKLGRQLRDVQKEIRGASGNITGLVERERQLERAIESTNRDIAERKRLYKAEGDYRRSMARADEMQQRGQDNIRRGAALAAPLILAVSHGAEFSSTMVDIQQKAGLTNREMVGVRNNIRDAARAARQMPSEMASFADQLAGLGRIGSQDAAALATPAGRFMTAFKVQGADAAAALDAAYGNLNIPLERSAKLFDMMAEGGNQGAFEVRDMAAALPGLTAQLSALGSTGEPAAAELISALQIVRRGSKDSARAATNMENILAKLTATSTLRLFEQQGIDAFAAMSEGVENGTSRLQTMIALTKKATGGDLSKLPTLFPDLQAQTAMRQLILDYDDFMAMQGDIAGAQGLTSAAFDQRIMNDQSVKLRELGASFSDLALATAPLLIPVLNQVTNFVTKATTAMTGFAERNPQAAALIVQTVAALAAFKIGLGLVQFALGGVMKPLAMFLRFSSKFQLAAKAFTVLRTAALFLASGLMKAGALMLANPIILIIVAIAAAIGVAAYLIYTHWDTIKEAFWTAVAAVSGALSAVWQVLKNAFSLWLSLHAQAIQIGKDIIGGLVSGIMAAPGRVWNALKSVVTGAYEGVKNLLGINSPSRVFMAIGSDTAEGMAIGIGKGGRRVSQAAGRLAAGALAAGSLAASPLAAGNGAGGGPGQAVAAAPVFNVTFNLKQENGENDEAFAERIMRKLEELMERRARSSYEDDA